MDAHDLIHDAEELLTEPVDLFDDGEVHDPQAGFIKRSGKRIAGVFVVILGIILMPLPGPGAAVVMLGLNMVWPGNPLSKWIIRNWPGIQDDGTIPRSHLVIVGLLAIAGTVFGILWGQAVLNWGLELVGFRVPKYLNLSTLKA